MPPQGRAAEEMAQARAQVGLALEKSPRELLSEARLDVGPTAEALIADRVSQMPKTCVRTYLRAMRGRSLTNGIRAFCQMCMGWDDFRAGVRDCTDPACPLYPYRPYRGGGR